jgi:hypothetical protein
VLQQLYSSLQSQVCNKKTPLLFTVLWLCVNKIARATADKNGKLQFLLLLQPLHGAPRRRAARCSRRGKTKNLTCEQKRTRDNYFYDVMFLKIKEFSIIKKYYPFFRRPDRSISATVSGIFLFSVSGNMSANKPAVTEAMPKMMTGMAACLDP